MESWITLETNSPIFAVISLLPKSHYSVTNCSTKPYYKDAKVLANICITQTKQKVVYHIGIIIHSYIQPYTYVHVCIFLTVSGCYPPFIVWSFKRTM